MSPRLLHYSDLEGVYDAPERAARLAGLVDERRDSDTLVLGTGDNTAPGVLSMVSEGRQALDLFAALDPDADTFGNHDFDYGLDATRDIVADSPQPWVSANVFLGETGERFATAEGVVPWKTVETSDATVGLVGVTDPDTPSMSPGAAPLAMTDPVSVVREVEPRLRDLGADYVVVLSHAGRADDDIAARTDVDAVLGGHIHDQRVDRVDGTVCTRPGPNGHTLLEVALDDGTVTAHPVEKGPVDEAVLERLQARERAAGLDEVVARVEDPIRRGTPERKHGESRIGNFVADAYRWVADSDVALQNTGGIREGPPLAGAVTVADLVSVVPFDEAVAVAELTGAELVELARQGEGQYVTGLPDYWHAHVSGMTVEHNADRTVSVTVDGAPVVPTDTYTLATTEYLLHTDHEFPVLTEDHLVERLDVQYEALTAYARQAGIDPALDGRLRLR